MKICKAFFNDTSPVRKYLERRRLGPHSKINIQNNIWVNALWFPYDRKQIIIHQSQVSESLCTATGLLGPADKVKLNWSLSLYVCTVDCTTHELYSVYRTEDWLYKYLTDMSQLYQHWGIKVRRYYFSNILNTFQSRLEIFSRRCHIHNRCIHSCKYNCLQINIGKPFVKRELEPTVL